MRDYLIRREDMKSVEKIKEIELRQAVAENMPEGMSANNYFAYCFTGELQEKAEIACYEIGWEKEWI